jgi:hypothetical protein
MKNLGSMFVAMLAVRITGLVGFAALALGLTLVAFGVPVVWLASAGAVLTLIALNAHYLLARRLRPELDRTAQEGVTTIYMPLLEEGTDIWRPVEAMKIGELGYMVTEKAPPDEVWAFQPGHILRCEERKFDEGTHLVAVAKAT